MPSGVDSDEQLLVVRHRPKRQQLIRAGMIAGLLLVGIIAYVVGVNAGASIADHIVAERDSLREKLDATLKELDGVRRAKVRASVGAEIDRKAAEEVRLVVKALETEIAYQEEEIAFYKGLMAPTERERGLSIRGWELVNNGETGNYHFRLVVQQLAVKHRVLKGHVKVNIVGDIDQELKFMPLWSLSQQIDSEKIKLRFKYFQVIEGELKLPSGFQPQRVEVVAHTTGKKPAQVEKTYEWTVGES